MQTTKKYIKIPTLIQAVFSRFKPFSEKVEQGTDVKQKRSYTDDMAIPRTNFKSQIGNYKPKWGAGAILLILLLGIFVMQGCKPKQVIVEKEKVVYVHSDSTIYKDSVVYVPVEVYKDYSRLTDTLLLETSLATARAWNDTNAWIIKGYIKNKQAVQYKYIEVEKIVKNDSIVEREVPVPYEVEVIKTHIPTWAWLCLAACIIGLCLVGWRLYRKFFK